MMSVAKVKLDNSSFSQKVMLRQTAVRMAGEKPLIMETHGGMGDLWSAVYRDVEEGVVFEKESEKADYLARQRPSWAVYHADCVKALAAGAGAHMEVNLLDLDPYGGCWETLHLMITFIISGPRKYILVYRPHICLLSLTAVPPFNPVPLFGT